MANQQLYLMLTVLCAFSHGSIGLNLPKIMRMNANDNSLKLDILRRSRRQSEIPSYRQQQAAISGLKNVCSQLKIELCKGDPYAGAQCPGTTEHSACASWSEICNGEQLCGKSDREACLNKTIAKYGVAREDECSGEESENFCTLKHYEPPRCGNDFNLSGNFSKVNIFTPGYPQRYENDMFCFWRVKVPENKKIKVVFRFVQTEENYDYLSVGTGDRCEPIDDTHYLIYKHSGSRLPEPSEFTVDSSEVWFSFFADGWDSYAGFFAEASIAGENAPVMIENLNKEPNTSCGGKVKLKFGKSKTITSPNFPGQYDNNFQCDWIIKLPRGRRIGLNIKNFGLEEDADFLEIGAGKKAGKGILYRLTGRRVGDDILTINDSIGWIRFRSDISNQREGFKLTVSEQPITDCGGEFKIPKMGSVSVASEFYPIRGYRLNQNCLWVFVAPKKVKLSVKFVDFATEDGDTLSVGFGTAPSYDWSNYVIQEHSGRDVLPRPNTFDVTKNAIWFHFRSDDYTIDRGFLAEIYDTKVYKSKNRVKRGKKIEPNRACGGEISREDVAGRIRLQSPGYPNSYGTLIECFWFIQLPFGGKIRARFEIFNTEKYIDELKLGNGSDPNIKKSLVLKTSGQNRPDDVEGIFQEMWIQFNSDLRHEGRGWVLIIEPIPYAKCGGHIEVPLGGSFAIGSPQYPDNYPPNKLCRYVVTGPQNHRLLLTIADFYTEEVSDYLTMTEGCPSDDRFADNVLFWQHSGFGPPRKNQIIPRANTVWMEFHSNRLFEERGFLINFSDTSLEAVSLSDTCRLSTTASPDVIGCNGTTSTVAPEDYVTYHLPAVMP